VNCLPSRPADPPSGVISLVFPSSASRFARRLTLFSLFRSSCNCFLLAKSADFLPIAFERGAGHRVIPPGCVPSISRTVVAILLDFPNRPRGDRRSRCRCRKPSGVRDPAGSVACRGGTVSILRPGPLQPLGLLVTFCRQLRLLRVFGLIMHIEVSAGFEGRSECFESTLTLTRGRRNNRASGWVLL
jgi:hypothetical protein